MRHCSWQGTQNVKAWRHACWHCCTLVSGIRNPKNRVSRFISQIPWGVITHPLPRTSFRKSTFYHIYQPSLTPYCTQITCGFPSQRVKNREGKRFQAVLKWCFHVSEHVIFRTHHSPVRQFLWLFKIISLHLEYHIWRVLAQLRCGDTS